MIVARGRGSNPLQAVLAVVPVVLMVSRLQKLSAFAYDCFGNNNTELIEAVDAYIADSLNESSDVSLRYGWPIDAWCVENVQDFSHVFSGFRNSHMQNFTEGISSWNVSSATDMSFMFTRASSFNGDLSQWDVGKVTTMQRMFYRATLFNGDLSKWKVGKVTTMDRMFDFASSFNQDIGNWDVESVTNMRGLFRDATSFNYDISQWDVGKVTIMIAMFDYASSFSQNLCSWGPQLKGREVLTAAMFCTSNCPTDADPDLTQSPPGPFCFECQSLASSVMPSVSFFPSVSATPTTVTSLPTTLPTTPTLPPTPQPCPCKRIQILCRVRNRCLRRFPRDQ